MIGYSTLQIEIGRFRYWQPSLYVPEWDAIVHDEDHPIYHRYRWEWTWLWFAVRVLDYIYTTKAPA